MSDEMIPVALLAERAKLARTTLNYRIKAAGIVLFVDPEDNRRRLIRAADATRITAPRPVTAREEIRMAG